MQQVRQINTNLEEEKAMQMKKERGKLKNFKTFLQEEEGMGTVEIILIIVEKPNAKHRYVLCGN